MNCNSSNGRIDILGPNQLQLFDKIPIHKNNNSFYDALTGNFTDSPMSIAYFSKENIQIIQNAIRKGVYEKSNGRFLIDNQSYDELKIIMRSTYLQNSVNQPDNCTQQIMALNRIVINYCVKTIYGEALGYLQYKKDASTMYTPIDRPTFGGNPEKTIEQNPFF